MSGKAGKATSVFLMAIMVAGGLTFAIPGVQPAMAQSTNANLSVSAESTAFGNYFSGPQVVEIVIVDPAIDETNEAKGEPDVKLNGKKVRMIQATDGKWYAYVANKAQAELADGTADANPGQGLDFGTICLDTGDADRVLETALDANAGYFSDTTGVAFPFQQATYSSDTDTDPTPIATDCTVAEQVTAGLRAVTSSELTASTTTMNVVREPRAVNTNQNAEFGQSVVIENAVTDEARAGVWPFIQLFDFSQGGNVEVQYRRGGGTQSVTLNYDTVEDYASLSLLDRTTFPGGGAQVHFEITDTWLDVDPTDEDSWTWDVEGPDEGRVVYQAFDENGVRQDNAVDISAELSGLMCDTNCLLRLDRDTNGYDVLEYADNDDSGLRLFGTADDAAADQLITVTETSSSSGVFTSYDENDKSVLVTASDDATTTAVEPPRDTTATIDYNETPQSVSIGYAFATIQIQPTGDAWLSGQEIPVVLTDADANRNSLADEDLDVLDATHIIPTLVTGSPITLAGASAVAVAASALTTASGTAYTASSLFDSGAGALTVDSDAADPSLRATVDSDSSDPMQTMIIDYGTAASHHSAGTVTTVFNYDFGNLEFAETVATSDRNVDVYALVGTGATIFASNTHLDGVTPYVIETDAALRGTVLLPEAARTQLAGAGTSLGLMAQFGANVPEPGDPVILIADVMSFGFTDDGVESGERIANQVVRLELEESGDNTGLFEGTLEYAMVNQLSIADSSTYSGLALIDDEATLIAIEDLTDEDTLTVTYNDLGRDGVVTPVSDDKAAPSHSGTVSLDATSYKIADTVTVTLRDADLNTSSDTTEVYTIPATKDYVGMSDATYDVVHSFGALGRMADITFDDSEWGAGTCTGLGSSDNGLRATGFTLRETSAASGVFEGDFQIPSRWCAPGEAAAESVTGLDIEVNYVDYRDASGEIIEVGDGAGVRANTGSVSLDRPVYPVPFGADGEGSNFQTYGIAGNERARLSAHDVTVHVRVSDPDFDVSASGSDTLGETVARTTGEGDAYGPLRISVQRGSDNVVLGYAGGPTALGETVPGDNPADGDRLVRPLAEVFSPYADNPTRTIAHTGGSATYTQANSIEHGPLTETAPSSGTFELDLGISWDQGPPSSECPGGLATSTCILQGDILVVEYTDPADASGNPQTVTDSATFDMRNAVLRSDKSVYIIGSDMILTLIEPDLDLDNDTAETYTLDLIEWDDDDSVVTLRNNAFDPEPTSLRETGDSTGIFQVVVEIPATLTTDGGREDDLERGEEIELTYQDWSPAGADYVGQTDEEIEWSIFTSDFGATIELDQAVYTWTDKVFITVVAPDHNFDSNLIDEIGDTTEDPLQVSTREGGTLDNYRLTETGTDTGIFSGEVILTGFEHDADGDGSTGTSGNDRLNLPARGNGPTDGMIAADDDDGITVSYEYNDDEHVIGSALIRWNVGDTQWLEASYPASGSGVVRVVDPDMNWNPEAVDNFEVDVYSDADAGGINLTVTETQEASGIFEGTVIFTLTDQSSGHRLRVAEGDTVTARYDDNTLPDPYTRNDELEVEGTTIIGTLVPPLERAVVSNVRLTDNSGNPLDTVAVGQQVQVTGQVTSGQETEQAYAYLVQVNDSSDVTLSLTWTSGTLNAGQSLTPSMSWQPTAAGEYTATVFVWESIDNPTALSPQAELPFTVG